MIRRVGIQGMSGPGVVGTPTAGSGTGPTGGGPVAGPWWDPDNEGLCLWEAWLAKGAGAYATSLLGLVNGRNLAEVVGAPAWTDAQGWYDFLALGGRALDTSFVPASDQSQSMIIQYANNLNANTILCGMANSGARVFSLRCAYIAQRYYSNGGTVATGVNVAAGNQCVAGSQGYYNGVADGGPIGAWSSAPTFSVYIGARNNGAVQLSSNVEVIAFALYDCVLTAPQVAAVAAAMAAL